MIDDLDAYRVGWELIDHSRYGYYGGLRARGHAILPRPPAPLQLLRTTRVLGAGAHRDPVKLRRKSPGCIEPTA